MPSAFATGAAPLAHEPQCRVEGRGRVGQALRTCCAIAPDIVEPGSSDDPSSRGERHPRGVRDAKVLGDLANLHIDGNRQPFLTTNEVHALSIRRGSLTEEERREIESHVTHTFSFLSTIPWTGEYRRVPEIASAWQLPDPYTVVFRLRTDFRFADGSPLTAADVKATYEAVQDPGLASPKRASLAMVSGIETPDPATVVVRLSAPYPPFLDATGLGILPAGLARRPDEVVVAQVATVGVELAPGLQGDGVQTPLGVGQLHPLTDLEGAAPVVRGGAPGRVCGPCGVGHGSTF